MLEWFSTVGAEVFGLATLALSLLASAHAVVHKREVRAAIGWVGVIWLVPVLGAALYALLGINRIKRSAKLLRADIQRYHRPPAAAPVSAEEIVERFGASGRRLAKLAGLVERVATRPLLPGNRIEPLINGEEAYPAMLDAVNGAQASVALASYIFDSSSVGHSFVEALARARQRGVEVRVLLDDFGRLYRGGRRTPGLLKRHGIQAARFMPALFSRQSAHLNLRNHRKILVVDGDIGFTGGMNIEHGHLLSQNPPRTRQDLHFKVQGPLTAQLQEVFAEDWGYTTGEGLTGERWFPPLRPAGTTLARGIAEGPDEDFEKIYTTFMGAIQCARNSLQVVTPYFLPDRPLIWSLKVAAMRGVRVDIVVPLESDHRVIRWAMWSLFWELLEGGCRIWLTPPPFDHAKLLIVDGQWALFGSPNWDSRSLRLNFEFAVECYDPELAARLSALVQERVRKAKALTQPEVDGRSAAVRVRDGVAKLLTPYL